MKGHRIKISLLVLACVILIASILSAETITLTTYYPSPFGAYDRLRLVPRESLAQDPHCDDDQDRGLMYYDNGLNKRAEGVHVCRRTGRNKYQWTALGQQEIKATGTPTTGHVVCQKKDKTWGVCVSNPSHDGTCGCR